MHSGDEGYTSLIGGKRVLKTHPKIKAYGTIDELNSFIGYLIGKIRESDDKSFLLQIQHNLFSLCSYLETEDIKKTHLILFENLINLENEISKINEALPKLKYFVLPGNCESNALAHICRTICRRVERCILCIMEKEHIHPLVLKYTNRLSDYFFLLARKQSFIYTADEIIWNKSS